MKPSSSNEHQTQSPSQGRFYIQTFGCQMNVADTERMASLMADSGLSEASEAGEADVILVNGCSVREKAVHKAVSALGRFQDFKEQKARGQGPLIGLGGCVGQLDKGAIFKNAPYVDFVFGPDAIDELPEIIDQVKRGARHKVWAEFDRERKYSTETRVFKRKATAFVNIMKGCDKFCTYCIVPFTRGREKSRKIPEVVEDVSNLVQGGVREITLLGQNVNSFGKGNPNTQEFEPKSLSNVIGKVGPNEGDENFPQLLRAIDKDPRCAGLKRIRFTSSHPLDFSDELIECYSDDPNIGVPMLARHLHLPVQSGSNRVLRKMGRHHQIENYVSQMDRLREISPDVGMSTDLIVGFPTETEEEFLETVALLDRVQYDSIYAFAYSERPGTRAAKLEDDVPLEEKKRRLNYLLNHQLEISKKRNAEKVGRKMEILVEGMAKNQNLQNQSESGDETVWTGRTTCNRVVNFLSNSPRVLTGEFVDVEIEAASSLSLTGKLILDDDFAERSRSTTHAEARA